MAAAEGLARRGLRVLRPQPRGIGKSTGPLADITLHDFARDVAEVIRQLGEGRAVVVGHAYGNWVARMTAVDHPSLVRCRIAAAASKQIPQTSACGPRSTRPETDAARGGAARCPPYGVLRAS